MAAPSKKTLARKRVAIDARRSDTSGDRDRSLPEQVSACRRWAEERGHEVARVYEELGSGVTGSGRPVFLSVIEDAERKPRPFDLVLVLDVSRFGRADVDETGFHSETRGSEGVGLGSDELVDDVRIVGSHPDAPSRNGPRTCQALRSPSMQALSLCWRSQRASPTSHRSRAALCLRVLDRTSGRT